MTTTLELMVRMRQLLHEKYENWYPILEAITLMDGLDEVEYYEDTKEFEITLRLLKPKVVLVGIYDTPDGA